MKKLFLTLTLAIGMSVAVNAQKVKGINPFAIETLDALKATDEQKKQIEEQTKEHAAKVAAVRKDASLSDEEKLKERQRLNRERSKRFYYEILTPEQSAQLKQMIAEQKKAQSSN